MKNNKGVSLVEVVAATAVLSIVALMCCMIMSTSSTLTNKITTNSKIQQRAELVLTQIESMIKNCDKFMVVASDTTGQQLYFQNTDTASTKYEEIYSLSNNNQLKYKLYTKDSGSKYTETINFFSENVTSFEIQAPSYNDGDTINYLIVKITINADDKSYTVKKLISLKNKPKCYSTIDQALAAG